MVPLAVAACALVALGAVAAGGRADAPRARLRLAVTDDAGRPIPFRAEWPDNGDTRRVWSDDGKAEADVPAGRLSVLVAHGIDHDAARITLDAAPGATIARDVALRRRFDARKLGWYGGDSHIHVVHGHSTDPGLTIGYGAKVAAGEGLDWVQLGYQWDSSGEWVPSAELERRCRAAGTPALTVGWNIEAPKAYMGPDDGGEKGNLHCFGHGWTLGLKDNSMGHDFFFTGPNFHILQEVQRQGGIVGAAHPVRFWFNKGNFVSNWNSELPFDFVAGVPYAAVDILNDSPPVYFQSEHVWYALLNQGYRVAGTGNSDSCLERSDAVGHLRTYALIDGPFTWRKLQDAIVAGRVVASSGPFALWTVAGQAPGAEFPADGKPRRATLRAWSGPMPGDTLSAVQLVRSGQVVRAWDLRGRRLREWRTSFDIADTEFAWYCVRVLSVGAASGGPPPDPELAIANPVYFLPVGYQRPKPTPARVALTVVDAATGAPLAATVEAYDGTGTLGRWRLPAAGEQTLSMPATASLRISAPGCETATRCLYTDCPEVYGFCRDTGGVYTSFYSAGTYDALRDLLGKLRLRVELRRAAADG